MRPEGTTAKAHGGKAHSVNPTPPPLPFETVRLSAWVTSPKAGDPSISGFLDPVMEKRGKGRPGP